MRLRVGLAATRKSIVSNNCNNRRMNRLIHLISRFVFHKESKNLVVAYQETTPKMLYRLVALAAGTQCSRAFDLVVVVAVVKGNESITTLGLPAPKRTKGNTPTTKFCACLLSVVCEKAPHGQTVSRGMSYDTFTIHIGVVSKSTIHKCPYNKRNPDGNQRS